MAAFPLPPQLNDCFLLGSFSEQAAPSTIRSSVEAGVPKVRRRYTSTYFNVSAAINATRDQLNILQAFYDVDLQGGALRFIFLNPTTGDDREFRFVNPYVVTPLSDKEWLISMELERLT